MIQLLRYSTLAIAFLFATINVDQTVDTDIGCDDIPSSSMQATNCTICDFDVRHGSNRTYTASPKADWCGTIENDQYIGFVVGPTGNVTFQIEPYDCENWDGLQLAIYDETNSRVDDCAYEVTPDVLQTFNQNGLVPGGFYYFRIDGYDGDICNFDLIIISGLNTRAPDTPGPILGNERACWGETYIYFLAAVPNATSYYWRVTPGPYTSGVTVDPPEATNPLIGTTQLGIEIDIPTVDPNMPPGTCDEILVEVFPLNPCFPRGDSSVITIQVCKPIQDTTYATVCVGGEYEFPAGSGDLYGTPFEFITVELDPDSYGCKTFGVLYLEQRIGVPNIEITNVVLCEGEIADLCGFPDTSIITGPAFCLFEGAAIDNCEDSIAYYNVLFLEPVAHIEMTSTSLADTLHAVYRTGNIPPSTRGDSVSYLWTDATGNILGTSLFLVVNEPNVYTLEVSIFSYLDSLITCSSSSSSSTTSIMSTTSSITGLPTTASLTLYPNPITSELYWDLQGLTSQQAIDVNISDVLGRVVWSKQYLEEKSFRQNLSTVGWANGIYSITFCGDNFLETRQVVKQ